LIDRWAKFGDKTPLFWMTVGCLFVAAVGIADVATGREFSFSLFYWLIRL